jgi:hypothetical protein
VEYLGHNVSHGGPHGDSKKIEAMTDWMHTQTLQILGYFLGITSYYRKFFKNYGKIVAPLTVFQKTILSIGMKP